MKHEEDNTPLAKILPPDSRRVLWMQKPANLTECEWEGVRGEPAKINTPIGYFEHYFNSAFVSEVVYQSNFFAKQKNPKSSFNLTEDKLRKFLGCSFWMSLYGMLNTRRYWSLHFGLKQIFQTMSRNEWEEIKHGLHFSDNTSGIKNKGTKFMFLIDHFNSVASKIELEEMLSVDEQIVPTKTRKTSLRRYNPKKWGYKIFMLCSSESGIVHQIEFYLGKSEETQLMYGLSNSASVVARLSALVPVHKNYQMFFDNWFSSVPLLVELKLKGILSLCTYQPHRIPSLNFPSDHHVKKNHGRGHMIEKSASVNGSEIAAVKWLDNKGVHLLSNFAGSQPQSTASRYNRKTKTYDTIVCPNIVKVYNKFMGGIDSFDSYIALYRTKTKSNSKFYKRISFI